MGVLGRHIDPTLPPAHRIIDEDGVESFSATFTDDDELWWVPDGPMYSGAQTAAGAGWAEQPGDIPDMGSLLLRTDERGDAWVVLQAYYNWDEEPTPEQERYERTRRNLWAHFYSWIARLDDASQLFGALSQRSLMGRWMPEGGDVTDAAYLPEMPWARAANTYPREWEAVTFRDPPAPDVDVMPAWIGYMWEGNIWDCSIEESVSTTLPAPTLFDTGELQWKPITCSWQDRTGSTVARHMRTSTERRSALLVRADWLNRVLQRLDCDLIVGWLGEKQLHAAGIMGGLEGGWSEFTGVAKLRNGVWTVGPNRISLRHAVR